MAAFDAILWDIDGTLLRGNGIGRESTRQALERVFGTSAGLEAHQFSGKTDWRTLNELMVAAGYTLAEIAERVPVYAEAIGEAMAVSVGAYVVEPLPNALELVEGLHIEGRIVQGIVTGNVRKTADVKLTAAGFDISRFTFGAYGDESANRNDLPPLALARAAAVVNRVIVPERVLIVGDTVMDIEAARAVGAAVAVVQTGFANPDDLAAAQPDWLLPNLTALFEVLGNS